MKFTLAGSLGNITSILAKNLLSLNHEVTVITSKEEKRGDIEAIGATPAVGSVNDPAFLSNAFEGADAVYLMTPPGLGGSNFVENMAIAGEAFARAIESAGVKRVVLLSSIGADSAITNGPIAGLHRIEETLKKLNNVSITFLRAGFFYLNFFGDITIIKAMNVLGNNVPGSTAVPMVHPSDIASAATEELQHVTQGVNIRYIVSDVRTYDEVAQVLGKAIGNPTLPFVQFTDEQSLQGMRQAGLPAELPELYVEMGKGLREGVLQRDFLAHGSPTTGKIKLEDFAKEYAVVFKAA